MPAGSPSRPDTPVPAGPADVLSGRYRLDAVLGQGGVGTVWRARDLELHREVALKQLQPGIASDPAAAERFRREATTAASLSHTSLVTIYDVGEDDGIVYLVMELVEGPSIKDVLETGRLEPGEVAALGHRVAGALAAIHARGLVHRDVKPGNVLLPVDGPPKVVDFGTVHVVGEHAATLTTPGTMMGTIGYVAPEQFDGHEVTPRADVYAVGLLLHECLTGRPTFGMGTVAELTHRRLTEDAAAPSRHREGIPPELDEIVVRATLRDPAQRFADAEALMAALAPLVPADGDARLRALARQHLGSVPAVTAPLPTEATPGADAFEATTVLPRVGRGGSDDSIDQAPRDAAVTSVLPAVEHDTRQDDAPEDDAPEDDARGRRPPLVPVLLGLAALALAVVGFVVGTGGSADRQGGAGNGSADGSGGSGGTNAVEIVGGQDLDPFGDSEHPEDIGRAFDGDPSSMWQTQIYNSPTLDKPGVGMWVQAAGGTSPRHAEIDLAIPGADVEVYALTSPPGADPSAWGDPVTTANDASGTISAELPEGTTVVAVWFTNLGPDAGGHRGGVSEVRLGS